MKSSTTFLLLSLLFTCFGYSSDKSSKLLKETNTTLEIGGNTTTPPDKSKDMKP